MYITDLCFISGTSTGKTTTATYTTTTKDNNDITDLISKRR